MSILFYLLFSFIFSLPFCSAISIDLNYNPIVVGSEEIHFTLVINATFNNMSTMYISVPKEFKFIEDDNTPCSGPLKCSTADKGEHFTIDSNQAYSNPKGIKFEIGSYIHTGISNATSPFEFIFTDKGSNTTFTDKIYANLTPKAMDGNFFFKIKKNFQSNKHNLIELYNLPKI